MSVDVVMPAQSTPPPAPKSAPKQKNGSTEAKFKDKLDDAIQTRDRDDESVDPNSGVPFIAQNQASQSQVVVNQTLNETGEVMDALSAETAKLLNQLSAAQSQSKAQGEVHLPVDENQPGLNQLFQQFLSDTQNSDASQATEGLDGQQNAAQNPAAGANEAASLNALNASGKKEEVYLSVDGNNPQAAKGKILSQYETTMAVNPDIQSTLASTAAKVGEAVKTDVDSRSVIQQVSQGIKDVTASGASTLRIQIHPEELGKIELKVVQSSQGVQVTMSADLPSTGRLLESRLNQLNQALSDAGIQVSGLSVSSQGAQGNQSGNSGWQWQSQTPSAFYGFDNQPDTNTNSVARVSTSSLELRA